jgi:hypothetical protein
MDRVHVWSCEVKDEPGEVAAKLHALAAAGANLEYVYTQRMADKPGHGVLYVSPLVGSDQLKAAKAIGLHETQDPIVMHIAGDNTQGLAHRLMHEWAMADINVHGTVLTVVNGRFVGYVTFDTVEDANLAAKILAELGVEKPQPQPEKPRRPISAGR